MEPTRRRPRFREYGLVTGDEGLLAWEWAEERLTAARNYPAAVVHLESGDETVIVEGVAERDYTESATQSDFG